MTYTWTMPPDFNTVDVLDADDLNTYISGNIGYLAQEMPVRATLWHRDSIVTAGNAIAQTPDVNQRNLLVAYQNTAADGDTFTHSCWLAAGTYTLSILGATYSDRGKIDWTLGGISIATGQDWYSAALVYNVVKTVSGIVIAAGGRVTLTGTVNGHNASSNGYVISLTKMWFVQAAD